MLCDLIPSLEQQSLESLSKIEESLIDHFKAHLSQQQIDLIRNGRQLRNKLLHAEFSAAVGKVESIKPGALKLGGVKKLDLNSNKINKVSDQHSGDTAIFGWLLECKNSGLFAHAGEIFSKMIELVIELRNETNN